MRLVHFKEELLIDTYNLNKGIATSILCTYSSLTKYCNSSPTPKPLPGAPKCLSLQLMRPIS